MTLIKLLLLLPTIKSGKKFCEEMIFGISRYAARVISTVLKFKELIDKYVSCTIIMLLYRCIKVIVYSERIETEGSWFLSLLV